VRPARVRPARVAIAALVCAALGACSLFGRRATPPDAPEVEAAGEWPEVSRAAGNAALVRDYPRADSILRAFAGRYTGTPQTAETVFLRSLYRLDPATESNVAPIPRIREARTGLDAYIAGGPTLPRYVEAVILRRLAGHIDSLHSTLDAVVPNVLSAPDPVAGGAAAAMLGLRDSLRLRDEELLRLRTELEQTKGELDRIRRRLAPPRP
jgi:hypothetical protein